MPAIANSIKPHSLQSRGATTGRSRLGANCLSSLFLDDHAIPDSHRAAFDTVAAAGFSVTEISHPRMLSQRDAPALRRHAENIGLAIRAVHAPPMRRDAALTRQREAAVLAAELGAEILVVHVSSLRFSSTNPATRALARERDLFRLEALLRFCAPFGLTLGLENGKHPDHPEYLMDLLLTLDGGAGAGHPSSSAPPLTSSPHHLVTSSSPAGLVFDSGHAALRGGDPTRVAQAMLPRLIHTHLHDNHGARDEHLTPGDGAIDWPALLTLLDLAGYRGARLLELQPRPGRRPADWERELAQGRRILSQD